MIDDSAVNSITINKVSLKGLSLSSLTLFAKRRQGRRALIIWKSLIRERRKLNFMYDEVNLSTADFAIESYSHRSARYTMEQ